jgi:Coenzyme PQQ synthesis protein D (PqqD)
VPAVDEVLHLRPLRHPAVDWRELGGQATLVLPGDAGASHELNEVASRIWALCDGRRTVREIAARLVEEFEVDLTTAEQDAADFVREMLQGGLLLPGDGASA